ncbi:MAG: bifunctional riboflavin kinase/FAD synthetase [bacterium]|nr:bifunctional riboflavin kinase/FAD synthetase [bacterium]
MKVFKNPSELKNIQIESVSIGTFDGVHSGHIAIINELIKSPPSLIITFEPYPREVLFSDKDNLKRITSIEEKTEILNKLGIENILILTFDSNLLSMSADDFIKWALIDCIKPLRIVVGYNHRFGKNGTGNFNSLVNMGNHYGFKAIQIPQVFVNEIPVSSSLIRTQISNGKVCEANALLGRPYSISSKVIAGNKIGRKIDYPTANLEIPQNKLIPKSGVYGVKIEYNDRKFIGMASIGQFPTFNKPFGFEVNIFNFNEDLLNKKLKIEFIFYIRENCKFDSQEQLKLQLDKDKGIVQKFFHI